MLTESQKDHLRKQHEYYAKHTEQQLIQYHNQMAKLPPQQ